MKNLVKIGLAVSLVTILTNTNVNAGLNELENKTLNSKSVEEYNEDALIKEIVINEREIPSYPLPDFKVKKKLNFYPAIQVSSDKDHSVFEVSIENYTSGSRFAGRVDTNNDGFYDDSEIFDVAIYNNAARFKLKKFKKIDKGYAGVRVNGSYVKSVVAVDLFKNYSTMN